MNQLETSPRTGEEILRDTRQIVSFIEETGIAHDYAFGELDHKDLLALSSIGIQQFSSEEDLHHKILEALRQSPIPLFVLKRMFRKSPELLSEREDEAFCFTEILRLVQSKMITIEDGVARR